MPFPFAASAQASDVIERASDDPCADNFQQAEVNLSISGKVIGDWDVNKPMGGWNVFAYAWTDDPSPTYDCATTVADGTFTVSLPSSLFGSAYFELMVVPSSPGEFDYARYYPMELWFGSGVVVGVTDETCGSEGVAPLTDFTVTEVAGTVTGGTSVGVDILRKGHSSSTGCADADVSGNYSLSIPTDWIGTAVIAIYDLDAQVPVTTSLLVPAPTEGVSTVDAALKSTPDLTVRVAVTDSDGNLLTGFQNVRYSICLHDAADGPAIACGGSHLADGFTGAASFDLDDLVPTHVSVQANSNTGDEYVEEALSPTPDSGLWTTDVDVPIDSNGGSNPVAPPAPPVYTHSVCPSSPTTADFVPNPNSSYFTGTVEDSSGAVLPGARVSVSAGPEELPACVVAASDGFFRLEAGGPGLYTITVDPPAGNASLGSSSFTESVFEGADFEQRTIVLGEAGFTGVLVPDGVQSPDSLRSTICLANMQWETLVCGRVFDRGDVDGWALTLPIDGIPAGFFLYYAYRFDSGNNYSVQFANQWPADKQNLALYLGPSSGGAPPNVECGEEEPTLTGRVTAGVDGQENPIGYPTTVEIMTWYGSNAPAGWATQRNSMTVATDENGLFFICNWNPANQRFQVVAYSNDRAAGVLGDTASQFFTSPPGFVGIEMQPPTITGRSVGATEIEINRYDAQFPQEHARIPVDAQGYFAAAVPFDNQGGQPEYQAVARADRSASELVPSRIGNRFTYSGVLVDLGLSSSPVAPNVKVTVVDTSGSPLPSNPQVWTHLEVRRVNPSDTCLADSDPGTLWTEDCYVEVGRQDFDDFSLSLEPGTYRMTAQAQGRIATSAVFTIDELTDDQGDTSYPITTSSPRLTTPSPGTNGRLVMAFSAGDIRLKSVDPSGTFVPNVRVRADKWNGTWFSYTDAQPSETTAPAWTPNSEGTYLLTFQTPANRIDLAFSPVLVEVEEVAGRMTIIDICSQSDTGSPVCGDPGVVVNAPQFDRGAFVMNLLAANATTQICGEPTAEVPCPLVSAPAPGGGQWLADVDARRLVFREDGQQTNSFGIFRRSVNNQTTPLNFPVNTGGVAVYEFGVYPPYGNPDLLVQMSRYLLIDDDATVDDNGWYWCELTNYQLENCLNSRVPISSPEPGIHDLGQFFLEPADLIIDVKRPNGTGLARSWVRIEREEPCEWDPSRICLQHAAQVEANSNGRVPVDLAPGTYVFTANLPWGDRSLLSPGKLRAVITQDGDELVSDVPLLITLTQPNFVGQIRTTDGSQSVPNAGVNIEIWDSSRLSWNPIDWIHSDQSGRFAYTLSRIQGVSQWFKVTVWPWNMGSDAVRTERFVYSPSSGDMCFVSSLNNTGCLPVAAGRGKFDILLDGANFLAVLRKSDTPAVALRGSAYARRWNGNWFDGTDIWAEVRSNLGHFAFPLSVGDYELVAEPSLSSGYSKVVRHVRVTEDGICDLVLQDGVPSECSDLALADGRVPFDAVGSNVVGTAVYDLDGDGGNPAQPLREGWIEVWEVDGGSKSFVTSSSVSAQGQFSHVVDLPADSTQLVEIVVNPSTWNSSVTALGLSKTRVKIWAANSGGTVTLCLANSTGDGCADGENPGAILRPEAVLTTGNLKGNVQKPSPCVQNCAVQNAQVQVQQWDGQVWLWLNEWTHTNSTGNFTLNLDEGVFRITARPPYGETDFAATSQLVRIDANGWCSVASVADTCSSPENSLDLSLAGVNVTGRVLDGANGVRGAWVGVERKQIFDPSPGQPNSGDEWTWWQWIDVGSSTSFKPGSEGRFALNVPEAGDYRVVVDPPWNSPSGQTYVRFSQEFTVGDDSSVTWKEGSSDLSFPPPNLTFVVTDGAAPVRDAWVFVEKLEGQDPDTYWQWADIGGGTRTGGKISLVLPVPESGTSEFRVNIDAPWNRSDLPRFSRLVSVDDNGVVTWQVSSEVNEGSITTRFPQANVTGTVLVSEAGTPNRWGFVEVRNAVGEWLEGRHLNQAGALALYLPDTEQGGPTTYRLRIHPNYALSSRQPIDLEVDVEESGGVSSLVAWRYSGGSNETCGDPCSIAAQLDFQPPNLRVEVSLYDASSPTPLSGAFVRLVKCVGEEVHGSCSGDAVTVITDPFGVAEFVVGDGTKYDMYVSAFVGANDDFVSADLDDFTAGGPDVTGSNDPQTVEVVLGTP